ncbi:MAG: hypothetical protein KDA59_04015 [Planctomycetales bacterium]|nr:hypothetical protein [Planctomycetales bacterium]MCA9202181.1 hypothetical protein [Planctomycetales bacterium]
MDKPVRPETLPGNSRPNIERPVTGGNVERPGIGNLPGGTQRPGVTRPGNTRPGATTRPIDVGSVNLGLNNKISARPNWVSINSNRMISINNRWQTQIAGIQNWPTRYPARINYWHHWGDGVRYHWGHHYHNWFGRDWWYSHHHHWCGWHYGYWFNRYPWGYWWSTPSYASCVNWFTWTATPGVWAQPIYYDYGQGGNVVYQDNSVYINGQQVASADEFAQSAMELATVPPPENEEVAAAAEWMPLGTFAVSSDEKDVEPTRTIQLAVNKDGVISGTLYNSQSDQAYSVQGQVDKQTQRVAFRVGDSDKVVVETGLYNLTQDEAPALVHYGADHVENWLLVRLQNSEAEEAAATPE